MTANVQPPSAYDPFVRGEFPVGVRTIEAPDTARNRVFPCEIWYPAAARHAGQDLSPASQDLFTPSPGGTPRIQMAVRHAAARPGTWPLVLFSHRSGGDRRSATFLCTHLASHGYVVAALDHSEVITPELAHPAAESEEQKSARLHAWIAGRVPDIRFLLDHLFSGTEPNLDPDRIGIVGHSFGGWTALAVPEEDARVRAIVALAPGGASHPKPGVLPLTLTFRWRRDVPALYLVAEDDVALPLAGMYELFARTPAAKRMVILRRADHLHFVDDVEQSHETLRTMTLPPILAWLPKEMRPIAELCSGEQAHLFIRGLSLCHMDATLRLREDAQQLLSGNIESHLAALGVDAIVHPSPGIGRATLPASGS
jgi:predicted dienelactone hydrolase